jgi:hypothetical protein
MSPLMRSGGVTGYGGCSGRGGGCARPDSISGKVQILSSAFLDWVMLELFRDFSLMMDIRLWESIRSRHKVDLINRERSAIIETDMGRSKQLLQRRVVCAPPAIRAKASARANCPSFASAHRARPTVISACDIFDGFVNRSARYSRARVRATPLSFAVQSRRAPCTRW